MRHVVRFGKSESGLYESRGAVDHAAPAGVEASNNRNM